MLASVHSAGLHVSSISLSSQRDHTGQIEKLSQSLHGEISCELLCEITDALTRVRYETKRLTTPNTTTRAVWMREEEKRRGARTLRQGARVAIEREFEAQILGESELVLELSVK